MSVISEVSFTDLTGFDEELQELRVPPRPATHSLLTTENLAPINAGYEPSTPDCESTVREPHLSPENQARALNECIADLVRIVSIEDLPATLELLSEPFWMVKDLEENSADEGVTWDSTRLEYIKVRRVVEAVLEKSKADLNKACPIFRVALLGFRNEFTTMIATLVRMAREC